MGELAAASRVYDERPAARGALDPAPSSRGRSVPKRVLDNADDFIEGPRLFLPIGDEPRTSKAGLRYHLNRPQQASKKR